MSRIFSRKPQTKQIRTATRPLVFSAAFLVLSGCASPISVTPLSLGEAYQEHSRSALSGRTLSNTTHTVLQRLNLLTPWENHPTDAIAALRRLTQARFYAQGLGDQLFALAELSYMHARRHADRAEFMAAALYAYAYLNPNGPPSDQPDAYNLHVRQACDLYMLALTEAFGSPVNLTPQRWTLPFGTLDLSTTPSQLVWHDHVLQDIRPMARLAVRGLENVYSHTGLGEPVGALPHVEKPESSSFQITEKLRVPLNLLLSLDNPRQQVLTSTLHGRLDLTAIDEGLSDRTSAPSSTAPRSFPLQYDQTAARALSLSNAMDWSTEYKGFLDGRFFDNGHTPQLATIEPHQVGRMPVVLIHGTVSSPARWANMVNDLLEDPEIRNHYEFWFFSYATGNPIPYSALQLRHAIEKAVADLGGVRADPALGNITLIGHSQGGLLAKMLVIQSGDKLWNGLISRPLSDLRLTAEAHTLLQDALFPSPLPEAKEVVFISTPQHGSYMANFSLARLVGRMVTFPLTVREVTKQVLASDPNVARLNMNPWRVGSVYGMSPHGRFIQSLAAIPVTPDVRTHSIIPVLGNQDLQDCNDGVVTYASAHVPDVDSELVVRHSGHSTQSNPITIAEIRRILRNHLARAQGVPLKDGVINQSDITAIGGQFVPTRGNGADTGTAETPQTPLPAVPAKPINGAR
ncbi:lipase family alpha/beta hydrolase [Acetobacter orleanensis]|uniref:lipase family alpha/beta hydrolase n=1 Tax=Acetobacter orleanensis TaxID=104099 RepID=UPI00130D7220|nr:alpha/beta fold hydrolase [Acetobacter orleanensis]